MTTEAFSIGRSEMIMNLMWRHGRSWLIADAAIVIGLAIAGIVLGDLRYAILALLLVLIVTPMMFSMLYIVHGTRPLVAVNCVPHSIRFDDKGMTLTTRPSEDEGFGTRVMEYGYRDIREFKISGTTIILDFGKTGYLMIPSREFSTQEDALEALDLIRAGRYFK